MSALFYTPRFRAYDSIGRPISGARLLFFAAGTTTPQNVFSDSALTTPLSQPVLADSEGRFPGIYMSALAYKAVLQNASGVEVWTQDNYQPVATDTTNLLNGISDPASARAAIGAGAAVETTQNTSDLGVINGQIAALDAGVIKALAGFDNVTVALLATGFGSVMRQRQRFINSAGTAMTTFPEDGSIPQRTEGTLVFDENITPNTAGNKLVATGIVSVDRANVGVIAATVFWDGATNATDTFMVADTGRASLAFTSEFTAPGVAPVNVMVRASGNGNLNLASDYGGSGQTHLEVQEFEAV